MALRKCGILCIYDTVNM